MQNIYTIPVEGTEKRRTFTSHLFYTSFMPQIHDYFREKCDEELFISLSEIRRISPLTIPNLLCVGIILKEYLKQEVKLYIPWDKALVSYLKSNNFFQLVEKYKIFNVNESTVHIMKTDKSLSEYCETHLIQEGLPKDQIFYRYFKKYNSILYQILCKNRSEPDFILYDKIKNQLIDIMVEICHNGANHSRSFCFANFQLNKQRKFEFSVSDCGIGLYESFYNKLKTNSVDLKFCQQKEFIKMNRTTRNLYAIFESIFFRKDDIENRYGLINIFHFVLNSKINGIIRIHTDNTQVILTNYIYEKLFFKNNISQKELKKSICSFIENGSKNIRSSGSKFKGTHIEVEIPFN